MPEGEVNASTGYAVLESAGHELDGVPVVSNYTIQWQLLEQLKYSSGFSPYWLPGHYGESGPAENESWWLPSVTWRTNYRKAYENLDVDFSWALGESFGEFGFEGIPNGAEGSYLATATLSGAGMCPTQSGMPLDLYIDSTEPDPYVVSSGSYPADNIVGGSVAYMGQVVNGDLWPYTTQWSFSLIGYTLLPYGIDGWSTVSWTSGSFSFDNTEDPATYNQLLPGLTEYSCTLSTEIDHAANLDILADRINTRSFSTFAAYTYDPESFDEKIWGIGSTDPDDYDGLPITGGTHYTVPPYFGADTTQSVDAQYLWSGWYFHTSEEHEVGISYENGQHYFRGQRCRFKVNQSSLDYFIAEATILRNRNLDGSYESDPTDDLADVVVISTGTTTAGDTIEIGWPTGTGSAGFITSHFPISDVDTLSTGKMRFAIVGETAAQWSARTGISYT